MRSAVFLPALASSAGEPPVDHRRRGERSDLPEEKERERNTRELKVTDKRIFTSEGDIREEYLENVKPSDPQAAPPPPVEKPVQEEEKKKKLRDKADNPGTPFSVFVESLIANAYMSMGMLRNPYQPQAKPDLPSARQMIDLLNMLAEKTAGNLNEDEEMFLTTHLSKLKMEYVRLTKAI